MYKNLEGKNILVAVTGGIAAYKVVDVVRQLLKRGAVVRVMMTRSATRFVHPTTFSAITGSEVGLELFSDSGKSSVDHLELPHWADVIIVAPATANIIAKMANGIADDLVSTGLLAAICPVFVVPAMNSSMYLNPATLQNIKTLRERGVLFIGPESGEMAAPGEKAGPGRMSEPNEIVLTICNELGVTPDGPLAGKKVLITAGRTEEAIDAVRVITNKSSGRMGVALAKVYRDAGAKVVLVHGPMDIESPQGVEEIAVKSALEMYEAVLSRIEDVAYVYYVAAVADWRPETQETGKLKREKMDGPPVLTMVENPDIARETAHLCKGKSIGFALETSQDKDVAIKKLEKKGLDAILLNTVSAIGSANSEMEWISKSSVSQEKKSGSKSELAKWIMKLTRELS